MGVLIFECKRRENVSPSRGLNPDLSNRNRPVCIPILLSANYRLWQSCKLTVFIDAKKQAYGRLFYAPIQTLESLRHPPHTFCLQNTKTQ